MPDTHDVFNQPPPLVDYNLFRSDPVMQEAVARGGGTWAEGHLEAFGQEIGSAHFFELGRLANRYAPTLHTHDRYGHRIDEVEFHPAWHEIICAGMRAGVHALPWREGAQKGAHVARAAAHYMLTQVEAGVGCPLTMTFAGVPALRQQPEIAAQWVPRLTSLTYDQRFIPASQKRGCLIGMAMTEKQGGSDVRANTTKARALSAAGPGEAYLLTGHKWFCSAPMCDAFLTLAHTKKGLSCFLVPRFLPDGSRNRFRLQRLKDKLGNRSNASSEVEYDETWGQMVGPEGRGIPTIIEMVNHTRLDCIVGSASVMRQAFVQAAHHTKYRRAFGKLLVEQPLMQNVLADLALESEAAGLTAFALAAAYDDPSRRVFARIATAIGKYWVCKRAPVMIVEALECHGGAGYVEESNLPRLYREAPLSSIWEGSGNVMCLDVLRAAAREPDSLPAFLQELEQARGTNTTFDGFVDGLKQQLADRANLESRARIIVEQLALAYQASLMLRFAPNFVADAFCSGRLGQHGHAFGTLSARFDHAKILERTAVNLN